MTPLVINYNFIQHILNENAESYGEILEKYYDDILRHITKIVHNNEDAQDLTNETFCRVYLNLSSFKPNYKFSSWLYRIATNIAIDFLRKEKLRANIKVASDEVARTDIVDESSEDIEIGKGQYRSALREAISQLRADYRTLIRLRYYNNLSYEEIARRLNSPIGTVKAYIHRAKLMLINIVKNQKNLKS